MNNMYMYAIIKFASGSGKSLGDGSILRIEKIGKRNFAINKIVKADFALDSGRVRVDLDDAVFRYDGHKYRMDSVSFNESYTSGYIEEVGLMLGDSIEFCPTYKIKFFTAESDDEVLLADEIVGIWNWRR